MNLDKLVLLCAGVVFAMSVTMNPQELQVWIWRAQAKLIYELRTETWGSPRFFSNKSPCRHGSLGKVEKNHGKKESRSNKTSSQGL